LQDDTSVCIINAHMAAGQEKYIERGTNFREVIDNLRFNMCESPTQAPPARAPGP